MIKIEVMETSARRYLCASWMNGVFPMRADVNGPHDLRFLRRLAEMLGEELVFTDEAKQRLGVDQ